MLDVWRQLFLEAYTYQRSFIGTAINTSKLFQMKIYTDTQRK